MHNCYSPPTGFLLKLEVAHHLPLQVIICHFKLSRNFLQVDGEDDPMNFESAAGLTLEHELQRSAAAVKAARALKHKLRSEAGTACFVCFEELVGGRSTSLETRIFWASFFFKSRLGRILTST